MEFGRRLAVVLPDLNTWDGQARSMLEIARRLSKRLPLDIYSFTVEDFGLRTKPNEPLWGDVRFFKIRPDLRMFRSLVFSLRALVSLSGAERGRPSSLIHATGACSWVSDVVQVQFVHAAWLEKKRDAARTGIALNGEAGLASIPRQLYQSLVTRANFMSEKVIFRKGKTYIAIANRVAHELERHFGITEHVHVIHHGVDPEVFSPARREEKNERWCLPRQELGIPARDLVILFVGAYARKGLGPSIQALGLVERALLKNAWLVAVGTGDVAAYRSLARAAGVEDRLLLVRHTKNIVPYYQCADLFLLPTLYEPFGLVILEAMACGLAPLVSRLAGASELIGHGHSGHLIDDPTNPREIASALRGLLSNRALVRSYGRAARAVAETRSWDVVAREYAGILEPLLERAG